MRSSAKDPIDFGGNWRFRLGEAQGAEDPEFDDGEWEQVSLPHTFNDLDTFVPPRGYYRGPVWYRKSFPKPRGRLVFFRLDALWGKARVWLNGRDLGEHLDGLVGFELDLTDHLVKGANTLAVRVDNSPDPRVLPGKPIPDYNVYGGLCGEAWLVPKTAAYFPWRSVVVTTPVVGEGRAEVDVVAPLGGREKEDIRSRLTIHDPDGNEEVSTEAIAPGVDRSFRFHCEIAKPRLWSPDDPDLYLAELELLSKESLLDRVTVRFGIRRIAFKQDEGFLLNGERLQLRGVNRHQDFPGLGNVLPPRLNRMDVELIRAMGGNFVRTSHYPQHPSFLDACDELGVLVYQEITTWQLIGGKEFIASADSMMAEMIRRDRNRPSVIMWGMMNEGRSRKLLERLKATATKHDPGRPAVYAENKLADGVTQGTVFVPQILGINYMLESIDAFHSAYPQVKLLVSEHTNADRSVRGDLEQERLQAERIASDLEIIESRPFLAGSTLWSMHDYGTDYEPVWPVQHSGVLDGYRIPKEAFHMLAARWSQEPVLHIASDWNYPHAEGEEVEVRIYTNCSEVELSLNGKSLGTRGGSPVVWRVPYSPGELSAAAGRENRPVVCETLASAEEACGIALTCPETMKADGRDCVVALAQVIDRDNRPVPTYDKEIAFHLRGPGRIIGLGGSNKALARAGISTSVVRSTGQKGKIMINASGEGLSSASATISCT